MYSQGKDRERKKNPNLESRVHISKEYHEGSSSSCSFSTTKIDIPLDSVKKGETAIL